MEGAAVTARITLPDEKIIEVDPKDLVRVLFLDDEAPFRDSLTELLITWGYYVDAVATPQEAEALLREKKYQIVIADISFDNSPISGDQFIIQNMEMMESARIVAITGKGADTIVERERLIGRGVTVIPKGKHAATLREITTVIFEERKEVLTTSIKKSVSDVVEDIGREPIISKTYLKLMKKLRRTLIKWLESREDPDKKGIFYSGRAYSARQLIEEIENETEVGKAHLRMLVNLFEYSVNLENEEDLEDAD